jgi:hypothetical protein
MSATFWFGLVLGATTAVLVALVFRLPWPVRLRWLLAAQTYDPLGIHGSMSQPLTLHEVALVDVVPATGRVEIFALEATGRFRARALHLSCAAPTPQTRATLERWCMYETPLMLWTESADRMHLYGPDASVIDLAPLEVATRPASPQQ